MAVRSCTGSRVSSWLPAWPPTLLPSPACGPPSRLGGPRGRHSIHYTRDRTGRLLVSQDARGRAVARRRKGLPTGDSLGLVEAVVLEESR